MARTLFSLHGINTTGAWQNGIRDVLDCFFDYTPLDYREYRNLPLAIWRLGGEVLVFLGGVALIASWRHFHPNAGMVWPIGALVLVFAAAITVSHFNASCLEKVATRIAGQIRAPYGGHSHPSIVAHSLGTLLVARVMARFEGVTFDTIILHGCVVRRRYPWHRMQLRFENIFNEIGGIDWVPRVAGLLSYTVEDIGTAGANGFKGPAIGAGMRNPSEIGPVVYRGKLCCQLHLDSHSTDQVHNIRFARIAHSGYHEGAFHAMDFWLPRLLGYDPHLYGRFFRDCVKVVSAESGGKTEYKERREEFLNTCYGWHPGPLNDIVRSEIEATDEFTVPEARLNDLVVMTVVYLTRAVESMLKRFPRPLLENKALSLPDKEDVVWTFLDPRSALQRSVAQSLERARELGII
jgi:hypothetical protein